MNMPVKLDISEFLTLGNQLSTDDAAKAWKMFECFMADKEEDPVYTERECSQVCRMWACAALYMAGYVSGVRSERQRRRGKAVYSRSRTAREGQ